nr:hypothetical protein [uncultured Leptotrichia sp.]
MKKLLVIMLFALSLQIFGQSYQVTKSKNVTLSAEQIEMENKEIERTVNEDVKRFIKEIMPSIGQNEMKEIKDEEEKKAEESIMNGFFSFFSELSDGLKFDIKNIKYISNKKAFVTYEVTAPDVDKILNKKEIENKYLKKYGKELNDSETLKVVMEISKEMLKEGMKNPKNYTTEKVTVQLNKVGNEWKFKDEEEVEKMLNKLK